MPGVVTHALPLQQPLEHDCAVQTHCPPLHARPAAHATHAPPPVPHALFPDVWQTPLMSQHPVGHVVGLHTHLPCGLQSCVGWHMVQVPPPTPQ
jgi:hypothetical protein